MVGAGARATGAAQALVHIEGTVRTSKARKAGAGEGARTILTGAAIEAWVGITVIDVLVTGRTSVPAVAGTAETSCQVGAGAVGTTGCRASTLVHILLASWPLPAPGTGADHRLARGRFTAASVLTSIWRAGGQQFTLAALDSGGTGAVEARSIADTGATTLARLGLTSISSQALAAARAAPARLAHTAEPARGVVANAMTARLVGTGMAWREAERRQGAGRTEAAEAVLHIHAGASLATGAGRTLINLHAAERPCEAGLADAVIAVDAITTDPEGAGVAGTVIDVHLAIHTCGARRTAAQVFVHQV